MGNPKVEVPFALGLNKLQSLFQDRKKKIKTQNQKSSERRPVRAASSPSFVVLLALEAVFKLAASSLTFRSRLVWRSWGQPHPLVAEPHPLVAGATLGRARHGREVAAFMSPGASGRWGVFALVCAWHVAGTPQACDLHLEGRGLATSS